MRANGLWKWQAHHPYSRPTIIRVVNNAVTFPDCEGISMTQTEAESKGRFIGEIGGQHDIRHE